MILSFFGLVVRIFCSNFLNDRLDFLYPITLFRGEGLTVDDYFDKLYLSHEIHAVKPEEEFYLKILNDSGENPSRSIFLDDLPANIQGAEKAGFKAYLIDPEEDLRKKITEILA